MRPGHRRRAGYRSRSTGRYSRPSYYSRYLPPPPPPRAFAGLRDWLSDRAADAGEAVERRLVAEVAQMPDGRLRDYLAGQLATEGIAVPDPLADRHTLLCAVLGRFLREDRTNVIVLFDFELHESLDDQQGAAEVADALAELVRAGLLSESRQSSGVLYSLPLRLNDPDAADDTLDDYLDGLRVAQDREARARLRSSALEAVGVAGLALAAGSAWLGRRR